MRTKKNELSFKACIVVNHLLSSFHYSLSLCITAHIRHTIQISLDSWLSMEYILRVIAKKRRE